MIHIVDYGMGNLRSVANAFEAVGARVTISGDPAALATAERIVLPGVGAFGEAMRRLRELRLVEALGEAVLVRKRPFLGICLGMQLVADRSFEHGEHAGLGWIAGEVVRIEPSDSSLRVPHIGWNGVTMAADRVLGRDLPKDPTFYFVHSYQLVPSDEHDVAGRCDYGGPVVACIERGHIFGTQFHPEKSQRAGLQMLKSFASVPC
jgi:imidazole glycerol-phosphate synthase subunit HisH